MSIPETTVEIRTLGSFSISVEGKPVAAEWPDEMLKLFFCSLLSPLDIFFTWDRICRAMLGEAESLTSRLRLKEVYIRPLGIFMIKEIGFNPLIAGYENIRIDQQRIHVDALEFHRAVIEGLRQISLGDKSAALSQINMANSLYVGSYLPGMSGKIIENTRCELESLYQAMIMNTRLSQVCPPVRTIRKGKVRRLFAGCQ